MPKMLKMTKRPKILKMLKEMLTIFEMQTQEFNHEGLFYHNGRGTNGGAAVVPPRGFQSAAPPGTSVLDESVKFLPISALSKLLPIPPTS